MPLIGWIIILLALALIVGSLMLLRDSAHMRIPPEKLEKIRKRKTEMEEKDKAEGND
ncbi:DUF2897 family protein [Marinobacter pelagius]|uniref:DUF2897 family protein n=1 Tax=Marinobacter pelagius TaxID=379482 RepID=A0A366GWL6_9GAMM|nr:DUF2897 family protein [Marinobacter pelagius]RBP32577.1 DUF2897 family protein [Marinobacter pelagius]